MRGLTSEFSGRRRRSAGMNCWPSLSTPPVVWLSLEWRNGEDDQSVGCLAINDGMREILGEDSPSAISIRTSDTGHRGRQLHGGLDLGSESLAQSRAAILVVD